MGIIEKIFKGYWYLFLITLFLMIPGTFGVMVGVWIIGSITQNIVMSLVMSAGVGAVIVTLPILGVGMNPKQRLGKSVPLIVWGSSLVICFVILMGLGSSVVLR